MDSEFNYDKTVGYMMYLLEKTVLYMEDQDYRTELYAKALTEVSDKLRSNGYDPLKIALARPQPITPPQKN